MIALIIISIFGAVSVVISYNKMYQAVTFSIALFGITLFLPQLYIIVIAFRWIGMCGLTRFRSLISKVVKLDCNSEGPSEESLLISAPRENNIQSLYAMQHH